MPGPVHGRAPPARHLGVGRARRAGAQGHGKARPPTHSHAPTTTTRLGQQHLSLNPTSGAHGGGLRHLLAPLPRPAHAPRARGARLLHAVRQPVNPTECTQVHNNKKAPNKRTQSTPTTHNLPSTQPAPPGPRAVGARAPPARRLAGLHGAGHPHARGARRDAPAVLPAGGKSRREGAGRAGGR